MSYYDRIKTLCDHHGISVRQLEQDLGFSSGSVCKSDTSIPNINRIRMIADYFNITVDELCEEVS